MSKHINSIRKTILLILTTIVLLGANEAFSQQIDNLDPVIINAVSSISADSIKNYVADLLKFHTRHNLSSKSDKNKGIGAASDYIFNKINSFTKESGPVISVERIEYKAGGKGSRLGREIVLSNIVATIKGSSAKDKRVIVLLAHYDNRIDNNNDSTSFAPGANDNGSGVSALIEIARVLSSYKLPVTIKLIFLSGEEHGLLGADHMAQIAMDEKWDIVAVINNDMIGNSAASETDSRNNTRVRIFSENIPALESDDMKKERLFNSSENDSPSRQLARYIKETGERYVLNLNISLIYRNDRFGRGGDHTPFSKRGFTSVRICEYYENYNRTHQPIIFKNGIQYGDLIEGVDFEYVRKNASVNLSTVMNLSLAPSVPAEVKIDLSSLSGESKITWRSPETGKKPDAYYLLIRETDKSQWERKILVKTNSIIVPLSRDNFFFGIQSVDNIGHESLPVLATGTR
ncbi:MAG: hypothetical protein A2X18_14390 [Bacteroidetes bacterium GWF2_40_14]|nr:MAG: hypothetical protein A2X18_14390 [Bacteroidetes bacterium GWF2_40_14]